MYIGAMLRDRVVFAAPPKGVHWWKNPPEARQMKIRFRLPFIAAPCLLASLAHALSIDSLGDKDAVDGLALKGFGLLK